MGLGGRGHTQHGCRPGGRAGRGRLAALLWAVGLVALLAASRARADEARHASLVIDANSGSVLHAQAADEPRYPASLTKMMTLYMAFELIDMGRLSHASTIKVSENAAAAAPSKLDLDAGTEIQLIDAMRALVTKSANDMAIAIAEHIGGTEANFARLMTEKARRIGMAGTTFRNASGLPDPGQVTTARDMATLALRLQDDFPRHYPLFSLRSFTYKGDSHRNHNTLLFSYQGTDGIKTGYTRASGFNLVASVRRDGRHVVGVIFGGSSAGARNAQLKSLLTRALARAATTKTRKPVLAAGPQPAKRTKPKAVVAAAPSPAPAIAARPEVNVRMAELGQKASPPAAQAVMDGAPASAPVAIEVARVRTVLVAPRLPSDRAAGGGAPLAGSAEGAVSAATPAVSRAAAGEAKSLASLPATALDAAPPDSSGTKIAAAEPRARAPSNFEELLSSVALNVAAKPEAAAAASPAHGEGAPRPIPVAAVAEASGTAPGARPTSLQEQAANLARGLPATGAPPAPPIRLARVEPAAAAAPPKGTYRIQVGAFATGAEAEGRLALVRQRASALVAARSSEVQPVHKGGRQFYRARFSGFDGSGAAAACLALRRRQIECLVTNVD